MLKVVENCPPVIWYLVRALVKSKMYLNTEVLKSPFGCTSVSHTYILLEAVHTVTSRTLHAINPIFQHYSAKWSIKTPHVQMWKQSSTLFIQLELMYLVIFRLVYQPAD